MPSEVIDRPNPAPLDSHLPDVALELALKAPKKQLDKKIAQSLNDFQHAACYIAGSMIFLKDNVLLERDLKSEDIKPRLLGHWGTCPGIILVWSHLNLLIRNHDLEMIFVIGPGHGAPAALASLWLEGSLERFFPQKYGVSKDGLRNLITGFSVPGGFPSHINSETPGSIHEGGELGYSLAVSFGAVMDNPDLIVTCLVGDGEAESGPTAAAWHSIKYIDPAESGAVIPILHVNGFKISERTIYGCMDNKELSSLFAGYGYQPTIVETLEEIDSELSDALEWAVNEIKKIQEAARDKKPIVKPRWPMIVLRTPKGWTGPKKVDGEFIEGSFHSHQIPVPNASKDEEHLKILQDWLKTYDTAHLLKDGKPADSILEIIPQKDEKRLGQLKKTYDPYQQLEVPNWKTFAVEKASQNSCMKQTGDFLNQVIKENPKSFRIFSPDELESNKLSAVFENTGRNFQWDEFSRAQGGRVIEILSEHCCQGWMQGYTLTGRTALFPSYESFLGIIHTMMVQYSKFNKIARETNWRGDLSSINYIETSTWARQEHNGFSHQNPSFIGSVLNLKAEAARVYLPPDANCFLSTIHHCLGSKNYVNLMIGSKQPTGVFLSPEEAAEHCRKGASIWEFASIDSGKEPDVVIAGIGVEVTFEVVKAAEILRAWIPELRVRVVNVTDLMVLAAESRHPHALSRAHFLDMFTEDKAVCFNYHGYAAELQGLLFGRPGLHRMTVEGYKEEGSTTTPFDMMLLNWVSRFDVAKRALKGAAEPEPKPQRNGPRRSGQQLSRKEQRKAQRVQKRTHVYARATPQRPQHINHAQRRSNTTQRKEQANKPQSRPPKQISDDEDDLEDEDEDDAGEISLDEDDDLDDLMDDEEDDEEDEDEEEEKNTKAKSGKKGVSKAVQERLAQDDAEIEAFERKLGIKKGRKSLPQSFKQDGLGDLLGDLSGEEDVSDNDNDNKKRKSEYDDWLASKRRKTVEPAGRQKVRDMSEDEEGDEDMGLDDESGDEDEDMDLMDEDDEDGGDFDNESFGGFDDDEGDAADNTPAQPRQRENPYVAPTTGVTVAKYVPPSLRRAANSEEERKSRLRKQVQGLINRLTDANILSIVKSVEELYQNNARGDVTDVMTDAIMAQICKPESLPDQFFVLTGGFAAAIYRLIGSSFGSVLIRRIVEDFGGHYEQASKEQNAESAIQKEASNILTLLSQLYVFEVVTCKIIFDYMERLLSDLNEINVELLLRICRMAGRMLKQDDQQSLKHVSGVLNQSVSKVGYSNISARTKFMVETITDLTKGKKKARGLDFTVVSEHVQRMKKRLGELKSQSRRLDGLAPMGVGLVDIEGAETRGKWWLVGASVPTTLLDKSKKGHVSDAEMSDHEDMDIVLPDYPKKARAQGLSGTAQIAIFTALMTASNFEHAYRQFVNLRLKKDDQLALATVLVQCVGSEMQYNPYYALVGGKACLSNSRIRFAIQDRLWKIFRSLGESMFGEAPEEDESADAERMKDERRITNVAKFYAALVADGTLNIAILKPLELPEANHWTSMFVQLFILALLKECRSKKKGPEEDIKLEKIFGAARDLPGLAAGIHWMLRKKVRKTKLVSAKELKKLEGVGEKAQIIVRPAAIEV